MAKRMRGRIKVAKTPRKSKKISKSPETVDTCDTCGKPLGRLYGRMVGSAAIALGNGISVSNAGGDEKWRFYCDDECRANHHDHIVNIGK